MAAISKKIVSTKRPQFRQDWELTIDGGSAIGLAPGAAILKRQVAKKKVLQSKLNISTDLFLAEEVGSSAPSNNCAPKAQGARS